jgi:hypothetical protein
MEQQVNTLTKQLQNVLERLDILEGDKRLESFYQHYLEKKYNNSHSKGAFGITDIETANEVIEIKRWNGGLHLVNYCHIHSIITKQRLLIFLEKSQTTFKIS